jgi:4-hydroxy-3-methylbut-2-enyl diphosphate reductase
MKIVRAKHAGFCYGVRRASRLAMEESQKEERPVYTIGPLIHNPQEVARMEKQGILPRDKIEDCLGGKALVRTHGIRKQDVEQAEALGVELIDATCPHVKLPRRHIEKYTKEGWQVLLVGDRGHPEVRALLSYAYNDVIVVSNPEEISDFDPQSRVVVIAQTTQSKEIYAKVVEAMQGKVKELDEKCTICEDAELRQEEGRKLAEKVDLMIVIGGRNSANTCRLFDICKALQPRSYHVEVAEELNEVDFCGVEVVGLTSGASTPDWLIAQVEDYLSSI